MNFVTVTAVSLICLAAIVAASYNHAHYHFDYSVRDPKTGDKKAQDETRDGQSVKGSYTFAEADGTQRVVEYHSGPHSGFQALVKRIGHAQHPNNAESHVGTTHWGHFF